MDSRERMTDRKAPGRIRDSIIDYLSKSEGPAALMEIQSAVTSKVGEVSPSSVRSYLNLNTPDIFHRTGRGLYQLREDTGEWKGLDIEEPPVPLFRSGKAAMYLGDSV